MANVQLSEIQKSYQGKLVVADLSMQVSAGEYVVLLGPSGCGKTTVLKIIAGLESADRGTVQLGDKNVNRHPPRKRDIAMVFQHDALYPHMTVRQSLAFGLRKLSKADLQQRIDEAVAITRAESLLDRMPENLSGGESRRAAIAKAIVRRAGVRLLDEPLSGLDANVRSGIQDALIHWHRETPGTTIHVTHDGQEAMRVADRIAVMDEGKIVQFAKPQEIYEQPATKTVACAIDAPSMIFLTATIDENKLTFSYPGIEFSKPEIEAGWLSDLPEVPSVEIGFRDRALSIVGADTSAEPGIIIEGKVTRTQHVDGQNVLTVDCDFGAAVRVTEQSPATNAGQTVKLFCAKETLHFFDAKTGRNLKTPI